MTPLEYFDQRVRRLVDSLSNHLTASEVAEVLHLVDHSEAGEGLRTLAWILVEENKRVPRAVIDAIYEMSSGLVDPQDLPQGLVNQSLD